MIVIGRRSRSDRFKAVTNTIRVRFGSVLDRIYGCSHRRTSFPITLRAETYIVCVTCGRQWAYDWSTMRKAGRLPARAAERRLETCGRTRTPYLVVT